MVPHTSFPGDCSLCHVPERWDIIQEDFEFDHEKETGYALLGSHADAACLRCHNDRGPVDAYLARGCGGCHVDPHKGALSADCTRCHDEVTWEPAGLIADHARTRFPLIAFHAIAPCESCHQRAPVADFRGAPVECHLCHQQDAAQATPDHALNGWLTDCGECHSPSGFAGAVGFHQFFPLVGGHAGVDCFECHVNNQFTPVPPDCFSCHRNDYLAAPNHVAGGFNTDCTQCHNIGAWDDVN